MAYDVAAIGVRGQLASLAVSSHKRIVFGRQSHDDTIPPVTLKKEVGPADSVTVSLSDKSQSVGESVTSSLPVSPMPPKKRSLREQVFRPLRRTVQVIILGWLGVWGAATGYDAVVGDGPPPAMVALPAPPKNVNMMHTNSTIPIFKRLNQPQNTPTPEECWNSLEKTRVLLKQFSPEVATWLDSMHDSNRIRYSPSKKNLAFYDVLSRELNLHDGFFMESDRHKLAILTHEYWHSRQNAGKHVARLLSPKTVFGSMFETGYQFVTGKLYCNPGFTSYGSQVEDEAYCLERRASILLGIDTSGPDEYFRERGSSATRCRSH